MIGVAKNQNVIKLPRMSRTSRKCTVSADSSSAKPSVSINCTRTTTGNQANSSGVTGARYQARNSTRIDSPKKKCTMFDNTVTIGRISAGKSTFLIRLPPEISTPDDSRSEDENHVQGSRPQKRKTS